MKYKFNKEISIGNKVIDTDSDIFFIAEAGVNHCGNYDLAVDMIKVASSVGADAIKFQSFKADSLILKNVEMADYQKHALDSKKSQYTMLKELELELETAIKLKKISEEEGLTFLTTPFDEDSLHEIKDIGLEAYKIASTDTTNIKFLKQIAQLGKPIILSTGMTFMEEIEIVLSEIQKYNKNLVLLQCTSNYPLDDEEVNLSVMNEFSEKFGCLVGFSDHTPGQISGVVAASLGARIIEKHFTLDKNFSGPDHAASLDPIELDHYLKSIRHVDVLLGSKIKKPTVSEYDTRKSLQKSIVANETIKQGDIFTEKNLVSKRAGGKGVSAIKIINFMNKNSKKNYKKNDIIDE